MSEDDYHTASDASMDRMVEYFEDLGDEHEIPGYDVEYQVSSCKKVCVLLNNRVCVACGSCDITSGNHVNVVKKIHIFFFFSRPKFYSLRNHFPLPMSITHL